ncbi:GGDEF domain-containing protein [Roseateles koreensis]|uniref:GGDEF domain-containing protein n=1 Tax=Roseateles koreensis TaxID=2987526 RepID=A0ABT5KNB6_9BURK|nr:GGDEF domain-containing protein [Roseateles koreensis]MDC8784336.1 GGDEF domain-containing protein [Roseateles koreensis]
MNQAFGDTIEPRLLQACDEALRLGRASRLSHAFHPKPLPLFARAEPAAERIHQMIEVHALRNDSVRQCILQIRDMSEILRRENTLRQQARQLAEELTLVQQMQDIAARQSLRFEEMARLAPVGLFETDLQGQLTYCNERGLAMLGLEAIHGQGDLWTRNLSPAIAEHLRQRWQSSVHTSDRLHEEFQLLNAAGQHRWLQWEAGVIHDAKGQAIGFICTLIDVTELQHRAQHHEHRANHDPLTGLPNRARFEQRLHAALAGAERLGQPLAVVYLDLDGFKLINDQHGHAAGDVVLQTVAARMQQQLRGDDMVARLGGDEFALFLAETPAEHDLNRVLHKLEKALCKPIRVQTDTGAHQVQVGCSMGRAIYPQHGTALSELLNFADKAMYEEKTSRRHRSSVKHIASELLPAPYISTMS